MTRRSGKTVKHPLFDLPEARADYVRASQLERFTLEEAAAYLLGCNPDLVNSQTIGPYRDSETARQFEWLTRIISRAIEAQILQSSIQPVELLKWIASKNIVAPQGLLNAFKSNQPFSNYLSLTSEVERLRQENAALKAELLEPPHKSKRSHQIIALVCAIKGFGYNGRGSEAPARISGAAMRMGISLTEPVVSKHLRQAVSDLEVDLAAAVEK